MRFLGAVIAGLVLAAGAAQADNFTAYDEAGAQVTIDTATLQGCRLVFDSDKTPIQICKMKKVEFGTPNSTRMRPGEEPREQVREAVYVTATQ